MCWRRRGRGLKGKGKTLGAKNKKSTRQTGGGSKAHLEHGTSWQRREENRCLSTQREASQWDTGETGEGGGRIHGAGKRLQTQGNNTQTETTTSPELAYTVFKICNYVWLIEIDLTAITRWTAAPWAQQPYFSSDYLLINNTGVRCPRRLLPNYV